MRWGHTHTTLSYVQPPPCSVLFCFPEETSSPVTASPSSAFEAHKVSTHIRHHDPAPSLGWEGLDVSRAAKGRRGLLVHHPGTSTNQACQDTMPGRAGWSHSEIRICQCSRFPQLNSCPGSATAASSAHEERFHLPPSWPTQRNENRALLSETAHPPEFLLPENTVKKTQQTLNNSQPETTPVLF